MVLESVSSSLLLTQVHKVCTGGLAPSVSVGSIASISSSPSGVGLSTLVEKLATTYLAIYLMNTLTEFKDIIGNMGSNFTENASTIAA